MACNISYTLKNISDNCKQSNLGGIAELFIVPFDEVVSVGTTGSPKYVDTVTCASGSSGFVTYKLKRNISSLQTDGVYENGGKQYKSTLTFQLVNSMDVADNMSKREQLLALDGRELVIIAKDAMGHYRYLGMNMGAEVTASSDISGTAASDVSHLEITIEVTSAEPPMYCGPALIDAIETGEVSEGDHGEFIYGE